MITEKEVAQAIQECMREPVTGNKRSVLADLIIIQDYLFGNHETETLLKEKSESRVLVGENGNGEFLLSVSGKDAKKAWNLVAELVEAVRILHPAMYDSFIDKILDL